jgi:hypothetical protein
MTDAELRAVVRQAIARHLGRAGGAALPEPDPRAPLAGDASAPRAHVHAHAHAPAHGAHGHHSHAIYLTLVNQGESCVIEPAVSCNHCGYCKTHGY